jgi:hypothetical protein
MYPSVFSNQLIAIRLVVVVNLALLGCNAERRSRLSLSGGLKFHMLSIR